jgi:hypothetical protein
MVAPGEARAHVLCLFEADGYKRLACVRFSIGDILRDNTSL